MWAYELADRDPTRIILPITAGPIERIDFSAKNEWLFLHDFKRVEAPRYKPFPQAEAVTRTLHALQLTLPGEAPLPVAPQPTESAGDLVTRGRAMQAQGKHAEALPLFERATELEPRSFDAWFNLGLSHTEAGHHGPDLEAYGRALALDPNDTVAWNNKGNALYGLKRYEEALTAYDRALALDTTYAIAWYNKGNALRYRKRYEEALAAYDRALVLDPNEALGWAGKGAALRALGRAREAEEPERRARVLAWLERVCGEGSLP
jgi:tetratricopeptide (TPR) repeat protein